MDKPSPSLQSLARRLLTVEAATSNGNAQAHAAVRVCQKLGISLTRFAGSEGYTSLLRRSLALARADNPSLESVTLGADGSLEGLEALAPDTQNGGPAPGVGIITHLLGLLVTFIGDRLTLRLVREIWPGAALTESIEERRRL